MAQYRKNPAEIYKNDQKPNVEATSTKTADEEELHPLELKYGKEPKIKLEDLWHWH